jgi:hypothetical protein
LEGLAVTTHLARKPTPATSPEMKKVNLGETESVDLEDYLAERFENVEMEDYTLVRFCAFFLENPNLLCRFLHGGASMDSSLARM